LVEAIVDGLTGGRTTRPDRATQADQDVLQAGIALCRGVVGLASLLTAGAGVLGLIR
jgi:hypothetical protein